MANYILLVFEGQKTEVLAWDSMSQFFLKDLNDNTIVYGIYGNEIYSLYNKIIKDTDLDLFTLIKENPLNAELLSEIKKDEVSEIFLFFDYDGHVSGATDAQLQSMIELFCEETENGKLYISYPMVEALKHLNPDTPFANVNVQCKTKINYKGIVAQEGDISYRHFHRISEDQWKFIINEHCKKLNFLMDNNFTFPTQYFEQPSILKKQIEEHITPRNEVAVLSGFPIFILDYYGSEKLQDIISTN